MIYQHYINSKINVECIGELETTAVPVQQIGDNYKKKDKCAVPPLKNNEGKEAEEITRNSKATDTGDGDREG